MCSFCAGGIHGHKTVSAFLGGDLRFVNNTAAFDGGEECYGGSGGCLFLYIDGSLQTMPEEVYMDTGHFFPRRNDFEGGYALYFRH